MKKGFLTKASIAVLIAMSLFFAVGCGAKPKNEQEKVTDTAVKAIMSKENLAEDKIKVGQVREAGNEGGWFVLYNIEKNGAWEPKDAYYGVNVTKSPSGEYKTNFIPIPFPINKK